MFNVFFCLRKQERTFLLSHPGFRDLLLRAEWRVSVVAAEYRLTGNVQYFFASPWAPLQVFTEQLE